MMLDATKQDIQRQLLEKELESVGIRLNKRKPNIYFKVVIIETFLFLKILCILTKICVILVCIDKERWWFGI